MTNDEITNVTRTALDFAIPLIRPMIRAEMRIELRAQVNALPGFNRDGDGDEWVTRADVLALLKEPS